MKFVKLTLFLFVFAVSSQLANAQIFWSETFSDQTASLANWTSGGTPAGAVWEWSMDPALLTFGTQPDFGSATAATGFMYFDSDGLGEVDHVVTLTSSAIDCSAQTSVFFKVQSQYASYSDADIAEVGTSTDGVNFTYHEILSEVENNDLSAAVQVSILELPELAGAATAYIQFRWTGNYEYAWKIDDIELSAQSQLPATDLQINDIFFPASSFATPVTQIGTDSMGFSIQYANVGSETQNNVVVKVEVIDAGNNNVLHTQQEIVASIAPTESDTINFPDLYAPELPEGTYTIRYSVTTEDPDAVPGNNSEAHNFVVTADLFANEDGPTTALNAGGEDDFAVGCSYLISSASASNFVAKEGIMSAATNTGDALVGKSIDIFLIKVVDPLYFQTDDFPPNNAGLEIVGANTYVVPAGTVNFVDFNVPLTDFNTGSDEIALEPGTNYLLMAYYSGDNHTAFHGHSANTNYMDTGTAIYIPTGDNPGWFGGWTGGTQCQMRMPLYLATKTDNPALDASLNIFPNPVSEVLNASVRFDQAENGMIIIANAEGKVITYREFEGVTEQNFEFKVGNYAAGNYFVRISNSQGVKTLPFVVTGK